MNSHGPDERLSEFYDGELSGVERAEVERLVTERPDLRTELSELAGLSQRLSDLADELPEVDLRSRVMQRIAAARPAPQRAFVASGVEGVLAPRRRWMPLVLTVSALTLLAAAVLPLLPLWERADLVATNEQPAPEHVGMMGGAPAHSSAFEMGSASLGKSSAGEQFAAHDSPMTMALSPAEISESDPGGVGGLAADVASSDGTGPSELLASLERRRDLKPGDIVSRLVEGGDVPMIADYTVVDVQRTANHVEVLLQEHGIVPLNLTADKAQAGLRAHPARKSAEAEMRVYLVDAESTSLNTALIQCQNLKDVVALNVEPLAYGEDQSQIALRSASQKPAAELPSPSAPAIPAKPSAVASAGASPPPSALADASEGVGGKGGPSNDQAKTPGQPDRLGDTTNRAEKNFGDKKMVGTPSEKSKLAQIVNGNSLVIENGDELYTEIQQRQVLLPNSLSQARSGLGNPASKQGPGQTIDPQPFTQRGQKTESVKSIFSKGQAPPAGGKRNVEDLQYGNNYNAYGYRNRQRAIVVLRPQSPPPPPEPTNSKRKGS